MNPDYSIIQYERQGNIYVAMKGNHPSVPSKLKVERAYTKRYLESGRTHVIRSLDSQPHSFFTGLDTFDEKDMVYYGNHLKSKGKRSFCVFRFTENGNGLTLYYYNEYEVYPKRRAKFISRLLKVEK